MAPLFDKLSNFRDAGGLPAESGRRMKRGVLYRSDELSRMTKSDLEKFEALGLKLIIDLRATKESEKKRPRLAPDSKIRVVNIPLHEEASQDGERRKLLRFVFHKSGDESFREFSREYYRHIAFERNARTREIITLLSHEENLPALIHCTAGKDRTGFLVAMVQLAAGVSYELVLADYLRTNEYFLPPLEKLITLARVLTLNRASPDRLRFLLRAHPEILNEVHQQIIERYGSIEAYLRDACGIGAETLARMRNLLLEPSSEP
jgi:protein-tyrosine phosphatase